MNGRCHWLLRAIFPLLALGACAPKPAEQHATLDPSRLQRVACIAVFSFENLTTTPLAGDVTADLLGSALFMQGKVGLRDRQQVARFLQQRGVILPRSPGIAEVTLFGDMIGADAVFIGSVSEYSPYGRADRLEDTGPIAAFNVKLVDVRTGSVLYSSDHIRPSQDLFSFQREPLTALTMVAMNSIATDIHPRVSPNAHRDTCPNVPELSLTSAASKVVSTNLPSARNSPPTDDKIVIVKTQAGISIPFSIERPRKIFFQSDSKALSASTKQVLAIVSAVLEQHKDLSLVIEGHIASPTPTGNPTG